MASEGWTDDTNVIYSLAGQLPRRASVKSGNQIAIAASFLEVFFFPRPRYARVKPLE